MKRSARRAAVATLGQAALLGLIPALNPSAVLAQGGTGEGFEFKSVKPAAPVDAAAGKIEVVEFFWYGCPHCHQLEPALKDWVKRLPADVSFRKVHVPWQVQAHQQLFFTLDGMGLADSMSDSAACARARCCLQDRRCAHVWCGRTLCHVALDDGFERRSTQDGRDAGRSGAQRGLSLLRTVCRHGGLEVRRPSR
jgi:thiol-disulfide isomerase/thioredoxin